MLMSAETYRTLSIGLMVLSIVAMIIIGWPTIHLECSPLSLQVR